MPRPALLLLLLGSGVRGACVGWRQTGGCDPNGPREPIHDLECGRVVPAGASGYCECSGGRITSRSGCDHEPLVCMHACAAGEAARGGADSARQRGKPRGAEARPSVPGACATGGVCDEGVCDKVGECEAEGPAAAAEAAPPTAAADPVRHVAEAHSCVGWRQTHGCDPHGRRDAARDRACDDAVETGVSGYCECRGEVSGELRVVRRSSCDHAPFTCADECRRADHYACIGWRQTAECSSSGEREPQFDETCDARVRDDRSGYCECTGERRVAMPDGCAGTREPTTCAAECERGETLYEILGVAEGVSESAVKQAFRRLSLRYHPDKARGRADKAALGARFAEIRAAYELLSDADSRALYDMHGYDAAHGKSGKQRGPEAAVELEVSLAELYTGATKPLTIRRRVVCKGCAHAYASRTVRCKDCGECPAEIQLVDVQIAPGLVIQQQAEVASKERCRDASTTLDAEVPAGAKDGQEIVFPRLSEQRPGTIPGDLKMKLKLGRGGRLGFRRSGDDLHTEVEVTLREALLGTSLTVAHLDGHHVEVHVPAVVRPGQKLVIGGEGMPLARAGDAEDSDAPHKHGALHVSVRVRFPTELSAEVEALARALPT